MMIEHIIAAYTEDEKIPCQIIIKQEQDTIYIPSSSSSATQANTCLIFDVREKCNIKKPS